MTCPKCGSENVNVQVVTEVKEKRKKGLLYWLFIGWWWELCAWLLFGIFKLFHVLFARKTKTVSKAKTVAVCQNCGHKWNK